MASWAESFSAQYDCKHGSTKARSLAESTVFHEDEYPNLVLQRKDMEESDTALHVLAVLSMFQQLQPDSNTLKKMVPFLKDKGFDSHTIESAVKKYLTNRLARGLARDMLSNFNEANKALLNNSKSVGGGSGSGGSGSGGSGGSGRWWQWWQGHAPRGQRQPGAISNRCEVSAVHGAGSSSAAGAPMNS